MTEKLEQLQLYIDALEQELAESSQGLVAITLELEKAQEQYRGIVEQSIQGIYQVDGDGRLIFANAAFAQLLGYTSVEALQEAMTGVAGIYVDSGRYAQILEMLQQGESVRDVVSPVSRQDGEIVILEEHIRRLSDKEGFAGYEVIADDITRQFHNEQRISLLAKVFDYSIEGIMITDAENRIVEVNRAFTEITQYEAAEAIGHTPHMLFSGWHGSDFYAEMWAGINNEGIWQGEVTDRRKNGETFIQWVTICSVRDIHGKATNYIAIFNDITAKKESEKKINQLAYYDHLTELPNRSLFYDRVNQAIRVAKRENDHKLGIMFIDLDNFKNINDTLGHLVGDRFLIRVAETLRSCVRDEDTVARLGGDEFVILLEGLKHSQDAANVAKNILRNLVGTMDVDGHELSCGASIGISIFPEDSTNMAELIKRADSAMYNAKEQGKNDYRFFTSDMNAKVIERLRIETDLRQAIDADQFCLYYQPKRQLGSGRVSGVEALLRWQHPLLGLVHPDYFLSVAEESGLISQIGHIVLRKGMEQARAWHDAGLEIPVALNVSPRQLRQRGLLTEIEAIVADSGCPPSLIELELTESAVLENLDLAIDLLGTLKQRGFSISLDDFGTGYSSLSCLKQLPIDKVKVDRSFIAELPDEQESAVLVEAIIALSHKMQLSVIAEGVESGEQLDFLDAQACDEIQGYYFSHPLPAEKCRQFIDAL